MKYSLLFLGAILACGASVIGKDTLQLEPESHLIGGATVNPMNREFAVLLRLQRDYRVYEYCNGIRLNERWILTPARCLDKSRYDHVRFTFPIKGQFIHKYYILRALKYKLHPQYDSKTKENNIALIDANFKEWAGTKQQLELPSGNDLSTEYTGSVGEVTSVEAIRPDKDEHAVSMITVEVANSNKCAGKYDTEVTVNEQICVTPYYTGQQRALTQDDIGVPVILKGTTIIGIATYVSPKSEKLGPGIVFQKLAPFVNWINKTMATPR